MRTLALSLVLLSGFTAFGQSAPGLVDKAPPEVDDALRGRVIKFYDAFIAGKFKEAYSLVAEDSQDRFFELSKDQYKSCELLKINYSDNFRKATVVTTCKSDWRWHGSVTLTTFPLTSTWEIVDGQWYWHYEKPTMVPSPFSPTGFIPVPANSNTDNAGLVPKDIKGAAQEILSKVGIDRTAVHLLANQRSQEVVHLYNDMPGEVSFKIDEPNIPGLKVNIGQPKLHAHERTILAFEWSPDDPAIQCRDCALKTDSRATVQLHVEPTGQVFAITVTIDNKPAQFMARPQK